jgi:CheY-like chemotaxis protein
MPGMCVIENPTQAVRVLVVDDSLVNLLVAGAMLKDRGVAVDTALSAQDALSKASRAEYGLILMDIRMAGTDGIAAARQIRSLGGRNLSVPIVALTADLAALSREACLAAGMDDFVPKPLELAVLDKVLHRWCGLPLQPGSTDTASEPRAGEAVDPAVFAELRAGIKPESFAELIARFSSETPHRVVRMRAAAALHDHESVGREAHTIKSAAALFGARRLMAVAADVESMALRRQDCAGRIAEMAGLVEAVGAWLDRALQTAASSA